MTVLEDAHELSSDLADLRHELHADPEVGLDLPRTQKKVLAALSGLGLEITTGTRTTSVTAVLRGTACGTADRAHTAVLLRGDMDALPVAEQTDVPWRSRVEGAMHACGHDMHTAMLVGAAHLLTAHRERLCGDVVFMFQPGEEGYDGASVMMEEGVLDAAGRRVDAAFAIHVLAATQPRGHFVTRPDTMLSASDQLDITVSGPGGHGSTPSLTRDPVCAAAEMVTALQTMVTRRFDVFDPVVISVGSLHAGSARNVIPRDATLQATIRTFSRDAQQRAREIVPLLVRGIASAHGVEVDVSLRPEYPLTINDTDQTAFAARTIEEVFEDSRHSRLDRPLTASEDFSRILEKVPGSFIALGATPQDLDPRTAAFNHSPLARYDDAVLPDGAALYAELALRRLASPAVGTPHPDPQHRSSALPGKTAPQTGVS